MLVDNEANFLQAFGSAFNTGVPGVVTTKELRSVAHDRDAGVLEDTLLLGDTALVNRTTIGVPCEVVGPDGSAMIVTARWDGDVWVEVDDCLVMETRRWKEGDHLVVARTVTRADGVLVTSKAFFGKPRPRAPIFEAVPSASANSLPAGGGNRGKRADKKGTKKEREKAVLATARADKGDGDGDDDDGDDDDAKSDAGSVYSQVASAVGGFGFGGLFGGGGATGGDGGTGREGLGRAGGGANGKDGKKGGAGKAGKGAADSAKAARFFDLNPSTTPFCGAYSCFLRGTPGHVYVFEFTVGFGAKNLGGGNKWSAPGKSVNNLEIDGPTSLVIGLASGLTLRLTDLSDRDALYDTLVAMLERLPPSPGEDVHGDPDGRIAVPLRIGFEPERYVIVHIIHAGFLPGDATGSTPIATAALGRYGAAVPAVGSAKVGAPSRFGRTLVFPAAEADLAADTVALAVAAGGLGDSGAGATTLGEAQLPLSMLPRTRAGAEHVKTNPFTVGLTSPGRGFASGRSAIGTGNSGRSPLFNAEYDSPQATGQIRKHPQTLANNKSDAGGRRAVIGELSIAAWIGTASDVNELGTAATVAEPSQEADADTTGPAVVRVPPAVSRVTVNVHAVRGVVATSAKGREQLDDGSNLDAGEGKASEDWADPVVLTCRLSLGDQSHSTPPATHAPQAQATWAATEPPITFTASEPRGGALAVDVLGPNGKSIGRADVDLSSLQLRPRKGVPRKHWIRLRAPPTPKDSHGDSVMGSRNSSVKSSKPGTTGGFGGGFGGGGFGFGGFSFAGGGAPSSGKKSTVRDSDDDSDDDSSSDEDEGEGEDAGDDDDYLGEILLDGFVDEGCGPTAAIGRKAPLGELSLEILSLRGVTPEGRGHKSEPAVMLKVGGSWVLLPAAAGGSSPAWRREIVAAVHDAADCAEIGVFDKSYGDAPLGFANLPVRRLPRGYPMVSTLMLSGGVAANPAAEITVRVHYTPLVSAGAALFQYFTPPLPRSAYIFGNATAAIETGGTSGGLGCSGVAQLVAQQREYCEESLLRGAAPLPAAMVGAMLPPHPCNAFPAAGAGSAKGVKACVARIAAALDPFASELMALSGALTWEKPTHAGLLHVAIIAAVFHPWTIFPSLSLWLAVHTAYTLKPRQWTLLGADKSDNSGSVDVGKAPPGSRVLGAELITTLGAGVSSVLDGFVSGSNSCGKSSTGVTSAGRTPVGASSVDTYEGCVQTVYWVQSLLRHAVWAFEGLHDLVTWRDSAKSNAFVVACFICAWGMLFVKTKWVVLGCCFVALRHPIAAKPATLPYRLGVASNA